MACPFGFLGFVYFVTYLRRLSVTNYVQRLRDAERRTREAAFALNPCADTGDKTKAALLARADEWGECADEMERLQTAMPNLDAATRFIQSNPAVTASVLIEHWRVAGDNDRCSNGKLRDIWKAAGGMVDKAKPGRVWIEADLLPGLLRLLSEIPNP
jgi:hypothetical protein